MEWPGWVVGREDEGIVRGLSWGIIVPSCWLRTVSEASRCRSSGYNIRMKEIMWHVVLKTDLPFILRLFSAHAHRVACTSTDAHAMVGLTVDTTALGVSLPPQLKRVYRPAYPEDYSLSTDKSSSQPPIYFAYIVTEQL